MAGDNLSLYPPIEMYFHGEKETATLSYYKIPGGKMVYRNQDAENKIDYRPLEPFVGHQVIIFLNGIWETKVMLVGIRQEENGDWVAVLNPSFPF